MGLASCSLERGWRLLRRLVELPERGRDERLQASQPGKKEQDARGRLCAWDGGFRDEGGGFAVVFVRAIAGTAKEKEKEI